MGLPRLNRLTKSDNFSRIKKRGKKVFSGGLIFYICPTAQNTSRLAVVCSSKLAGARKRNRIKRLIREVFRLNSGRFIKNADIIAIPQNNAVPSINYSYVEKHFFEVMKKAGILKI